MTNPTSYWPGEAIGRFRTPAIAKPQASEFREVAAAYIAQVAPTLPPLAAQVLASSVIQFLFSDSGSGMYFELPESLLPYERWHWPELMDAAPFDLANGWRNWDSDLWEYDNWLNLSEADRLSAEEESATLRDWFFSAPMTQVRVWRNEYLPDVAKRQRKYVLLSLLAQIKPFPIGIQVEFEEWRKALLTESNALYRKAMEPPIPRHMAWLCGLTIERLQSHYYVHYSCAGPAALKLLTDTLLNSPAEKRLAAKAELIRIATVDLAPHRVSSFFQQADYLPAVDLAKRRVLAAIEHVSFQMSDDAALKKEIRTITSEPDSGGCSRCAQRKRRHKRGTFPPFNITCGCSISSPNRRNSSTTREQCQADLEAWVLRGFAGVYEPALNREELILRCSVDLYMEELHQRIDRGIAAAS